MALVMLPCDLPWWPTLQRYLTKLLSIKHTIELIDQMSKIYELCNISLDPDDEEKKDPDLFIGLLNFLDNDLTCEERSNFLTKTLPNMVNRALQLKQWKPGGGLHFSLQQQSDCTELDYKFISSLIAHCFFSSFPRRTEKTHPTLQDFNFTYFFKNLTSMAQKSKLKSILYYFDWLECNETTINGDGGGTLKISRQVMSSKEWLTIEDWLECTLPLCSLQIKHEGRMDRADSDDLYICFSTARIGGHVLSDGISQECINFSTLPELLTLLLYVEALEDNEVLTIEHLRHIARINDPKNRACFEKIQNARQMTLCCVDPEDYHKLPISQYEEDNILRELNKCLLGFLQKHLRTAAAANNMAADIPQQHLHQSARRLSPIGESMSSTPPETNIIVTQPSSSSNKSLSPQVSQHQLKLKKDLIPRPTPILQTNRTNANLLNSRRGRFIVLGSSGECLPVNRRPINMDQHQNQKSLYSSCSCSSSDDEFHSAKASLDEDDDADYNRRYSMELDTPERRHTFAQRLRDALRRETNSLNSSTDESSYAVGISVAGSGLCDADIKLRRGGSRGFMLKDESESVDEELLKDSLEREQKWIDKFKSKHPGLTRNDTNNSSKYSFSTEYSSELEELYEQFSKWLDDPILDTNEDSSTIKRELDARDLAVVRFAGSLLKRTLSESFAGVPLTTEVDTCTNLTNANEENTNDDYIRKKGRLVMNARSLSLELARQKHKLAAQLVSQLVNKPKNGLKSVCSGNWGCGSSRAGDVQLKVILQWLAASVAGVPSLIYYTAGHEELTTLDTLCRIIVDRKWTVKDLAQEMLTYSTHFLHGKHKNGTLFEDLIGLERTTDK